MNMYWRRFFFPNLLTGHSFERVQLFSGTRLCWWFSHPQRIKRQIQSPQLPLLFPLRCGYTDLFRRHLRFLHGRQISKNFLGDCFPFSLLKWSRLNWETGSLLPYCLEAKPTPVSSLCGLGSFHQQTELLPWQKFPCHPFFFFMSERVSSPPSSFLANDFLFFSFSTGGGSFPSGR